MTRGIWTPRIVFILAVLAVVTAGCGDMSGKNVPYYPPEGNIEGYVYAKVYNEGAVRRVETLRVAGRTVPDGYVPLQGARVTVLTTEYADTTDSDGKFYFEDVEAGTYNLQAEKNGQSITFSVTVTDGVTTVVNDTEDNEDMSISPSNTGTLTVRASATCATVIPAQAYVYMKNSTQSDFATTTYQTPLAIITDIAAGTYSVKVMSDDYMEPAAKDVTIAADGAESLSFTLTPSATNVSPAAQITLPSDGSQYDQYTNITFTGTGTDCEDGTLTGSSLVWTSSIDGRIGTGAALTYSQLSPGSHVITLAVTDSGGKTNSDTIDLTISESDNTAPVATIQSPSDGGTYNQGESINFIGTGTDDEDGVLTGSSLVWTSNVDGQIGTGPVVQSSSLTSGDHIITLTVTDSAGDTDSDTASITVSTTQQQTAPAAVIATPLEGSEFNSGATITFSGAGTDNEDGTLSGSSLVWTSNIDNQIGTGNFLQLTNLSSGSHTITLTATDSDGMTGTDTRSITVSGTQQDNAPVVTIATPTNGSEYGTNSTVTFSGAATDTEDGTVSGTSLVWTSSLDGSLGAGGFVQETGLSIGSHTIILTATDSDGNTGTDSVGITVSSTPESPTVTIGFPIDGSTYSSGATVYFVGGAVDAENNPLTGSSLVWTSDIDAQIGTGTNFPTSSLSTGNHTITLTATDSDNLTGTASISLTIN